VKNAALSISHTAEQAIAQVILETEAGSEFRKPSLAEDGTDLIGLIRRSSSARLSPSNSFLLCRHAPTPRRFPTPIRNPWECTLLLSWASPALRPCCWSSRSLDCSRLCSSTTSLFSRFRSLCWDSAPAESSLYLLKPRLAAHRHAHACGATVHREFDSGIARARNRAARAGSARGDGQEFSRSHGAVPRGGNAFLSDGIAVLRLSSPAKPGACIPRLYGADLCGALACLAVVPLLNWIGGPNTILVSAGRYGRSPPIVG
jgi:hypothetical protein